MNAAGFASFAVQAPGARQHDESGAPDGFERDRRRVLSASAFRRLQYKTQVFVTPAEDHFRTRLTHTLEVASLARWLAAGLGVNAALAEVIALAHDVGHPPFGHAGERALDQAMVGYGGFEHNAQSLRVVEYLEHPFPPFRGLNLALEVREGLATHRTAYDRPADVCTEDPALVALLRGSRQAALEGQLVDLADRLAYNAHDLEDALGAGLIGGEDLDSVELWRVTARTQVTAHPGASTFAIWRPVIERLQEQLITDVVMATTERLHAAGVTTLEDIRNAGAAMVGFSQDMAARVADLERFLRTRVYAHDTLQQADRAAAAQVGGVFSALVADPRHLPERFTRRIPEQGVHRVVCDYVAGMTDRFCRATAARWCPQVAAGPTTGRS